MKRKLVFYILCFFAGEAMVLCGVRIVFSILLCVMLVVFLFVIWPGIKRLLLVAAAAFCIGAFLTGLAIENEQALQAYGGRVVEIEGIVTGLKGSDSFVLDARRLFYKGIETGHNGKFLVELWDNSMLTEGNSVRVQGVLDIGSGSEYIAYIRSMGIRAVLFSSPGYVRITGQGAGPVRYFSFAVASGVRGMLEAGFTPGHAEFIKGMLLGGREVTIATRERFSAAGISHLLAVSGLHVGIISGMLIWISQRIGLPSGLRFMVICLFLVIFCFMTGLTPSVIRASIMVAIVLLAQVVYRKPDGLTALAFAAFLLSAANPFVIYNLSFQLSFLAVLGIILYYPFLSRLFSFAGKFIGNALSVTISAQLLLIPIIIRHFEVITPVSVITNIIIIPLSAVVIWLAVFFIALTVLRLPLTGIVSLICGIILNMMDYIIDVADRVPFGNISIVAISAPAFAGYYILAALAAVIVNPAGIRPRNDDKGREYAEKRLPVSGD
jgi:competence protein ComEC